MIGKSIKKLRKSKKLTQNEFAQKLGVSRQAICMWESDKRELKATMLKKIARLLKVSTDEIVEPFSIQLSEREVFEMKKRKGKRTRQIKEGTMAKNKKIKRSF